jgi:DNA-binding transcriptional LysR family regulator
MDLSSQMVLFARVVDAGSLSAAARTLNQSPSAVSKQVSHLEDRVGVRLLNRSSSGISLTDEGQQFYERCSEIARSISDAEEMIVSLSEKPKGRLHVLATVAFGKSQVMPIMPSFLEKYPEVKLTIDLTDTRRDFTDDRIDLGILFTEQIEDQTLVARKLTHNKRVVCASPAYLERYGTPERFSDLKKHNYLRLSTVERWNDWHLEGGEFYPRRLPSNLETNSADAVYHAALAGIGVARLSTYLIAPDLASGRLVRLFPEYEDTRSDIYAVYSNRRNLSPKVRALIDHLVSELGPVPPWER